MIFIYILIVGAAYEFGFYTYGCDTPSPGTKNVFRNFSQLESLTYEQRKRLSAHYVEAQGCIFLFHHHHREPFVVLTTMKKAVAFTKLSAPFSRTTKRRRPGRANNTIGRGFWQNLLRMHKLLLLLFTTTIFKGEIY